VPEIVPHESAGLLIPPNDPAALIASTRLLAESPDLCARLRKGALQKAAEHSPDRFVTEYLSIYQQALQ
jgi:glycosyltransferase involved in cell wall biosynthesis